MTTSAIKSKNEMIVNVSALETVVLKAIYAFALKTKNINFPKELLVEKEVVSGKQLNALINNLKAKKIIEVNVDLFGFHMVSMSFDGVKFCKKLSARKAK